MRISDWSSDVCSSDLQGDRIPTSRLRAGDRPAGCRAGAVVDGETVGHRRERRRMNIERPLQEQKAMTDAKERAFSDIVPIVEPRPKPRNIGLTEIRSPRSEEHTSELQSLMRNSYAVFC